MNYKKIFVVILAATAFCFTFASSAMASAKDKTIFDLVFSNVFDLGTNSDKTTTDDTSNTAPAITKIPSNCRYSVPAEGETIAAELITVRNKLRVDPGEKFKVKIFLRNTGNSPWFSSSSECSGNKISLITDLERGRSSIFYNPSINEDDNNWESASAIKMDQEKVNPGEIASFTFWSKAQTTTEVYKEYFTPVVNGVTWLENSQASFYVMIGDTGENKTDLRKKMLYASSSQPMSAVNLQGEKKLLVDLSDQKMHVMLDGKIVKEFTVSTGAYKTPTPKGEYSIKLKQEVRVSGKAPHYIMPKFMWFKDGGYGIHALPSLGSDGGVFWTEARDHIGRPVSHGCIRLLPEDADFAYEFADLGTKVEVRA